MEHLIRTYQEAFEQFGDSPKAVLWPKGRQDVRFKALTKYIHKTTPFSILDFGCGLGHLCDFLQEASYNQFSYTGVDLVPAFIEHNQQKFSTHKFQCIKQVSDIKGQYDYIVSSGAFNILYCADMAQHQEMVFDALEHLFQCANVALSVNFMRDEVDYMQESAFHQNINLLYTFVSTSLSKRIDIDTTYMPFEYTITVFKQQEFTKPDLLYSFPVSL